MSCLQNEEILERLFEDALFDLSLANDWHNTGLTSQQLEEIAATEAYKRFEDLAQWVLV